MNYLLTAHLFLKIHRPHMKDCQSSKTNNISAIPMIKQIFVLGPVCFKNINVHTVFRKDYTNTDHNKSAISKPSKNKNPWIPVAAGSTSRTRKGLRGQQIAHLKASLPQSPAGLQSQANGQSRPLRHPPSSCSSCTGH